MRRYRSKEDERVLMIEITKEGQALRERALSVTQKMSGCAILEPAEALELYRLLYKILSASEEQSKK